MGKEVFGGTGMNFLTPLLQVVRSCTLPTQLKCLGDAVWTAVDGFSGATALGLANAGGVAALADAGITWADAFIGNIQGSVGEVSTLAIFAGGAVLLWTRIAAWRIVAGVNGWYDCHERFAELDWL